MNVRWQYRCEVLRDEQGRVDVTPSIEKYLAFVNQAGSEGWEVYALMGGAIHLKRPISE